MVTSTVKINKNATSDSYLDRQLKLVQRLKSVKTHRFKMSFKPKSGADDSTRESKDAELDKVVVEFIKDPDYHLYMNAGLDTTSSQILADQVLGMISHYLRKGERVPEEDANLLADALDRVQNSGQSVNFLHGNRRAGRPPRDRIIQFHIFKTIEIQHSKLGRLSSSRKGEGAYDAARSILQSEGTYLEVDELKRVRQQVRQTASKDTDYFFELATYLGGMGYEMIFDS